jgi:hypothetical protein
MPRTLDPGCSYFLYYLEAGITATGFTYSWAKLHDSCVSLVDSFLAGHTFRFPRRTGAAISLLRRIVRYAYDVLGMPSSQMCLHHFEFV